MVSELRGLAASLRIALASLVLLLIATLVLWTPALMSVGPDVPTAATVAALTLVFAAMIRLRSPSMVFAFARVGATYTRSHDARPMRPGLPTDPVHHPLRPRAPGPR